MRHRALATGLLLTLVAGLAVVNPLQVASAAVTPSLPFHAGVVSVDPNDVTPHVLNGDTEAVVDLGSRVIIGGNFTQVKKWSNPTVFTRNHIFAYDKATGNIDTVFTPALDGKVTSMVLAADGNIYVGGQFKTVNGASAQYLVKLNPVTGALIPTFNPTPSGMVYDIRLVNDALWLGGTFTKVKSTPRGNFAAVNPVTGALLGSDVPFVAAATGFTRVMRMAITPDGSSMVVIGNFTTAGGQYRPNVAKLDLSPGGNASVNSWFTDQFRYGTCSSTYDTYIRDVAYSPDGSYFVIGTTGAWRGTTTQCDALSRWENSGTGTVQPTWRDYTGGDSITAVAVTGGAVYAAGHTRWANNNIPSGGDRLGTGGIVRQGIAAFDPESGVPLAWNPSRERGIAVWRMTPTDDGMYILSDSSGFGSEWHPRVTFVPTAGGYVPVSIPAANLPVNLRYAGTSTNPGSQPDQLFERGYNGALLGPQSAAATPATTWSQVRGVIAANGRTFRALANGTIVQSTDGVNWSTMPSWITFSNLTAMAYGSGVSGGGRIFYTINNDQRLYARGFTADYPLVSTLLNTVSGVSDGMDWRGTVGMTIVADQLYHARSDGTLRRTTLVAGAPLAATTVTISGPAIDGVDWRNTRALHTVPGTLVPATTTTSTTTTSTTTTSTTTTTLPTTTTTLPSTVLLSDGFDSGLAGWTNVSGLTVDGVNGGPNGTAPSIRADAVGVRSSAQRSFVPPNNRVCAAISVKVDSQTANLNLMRLRTSTSSIARLYMNTSQSLYLRSDVASTQASAARRLVLGTWNRVELCVTVAGATGTIQVKVNGVATTAPWVVNTGSTPISVIEIGEPNINTYSASFDDLLLTSPPA